MRLTWRKLTRIIIGILFVVCFNLFVFVLLVVSPDSDSERNLLNGRGIVRRLDSLPENNNNFGPDRAKRGLTAPNTNTTQGSKRNAQSKFHLPSAAPEGSLEVSDVFISVKTTHRYHADRVQLLLETWAQHALDVTFFFTDKDDEEYSKKTGGHMINTNCSAGHTRMSLCCKMSVEYDYYINSNKMWFCHVDDDTYLNLPALLSLLSRHTPTDDWYLGKPSLNHPLQISDPNHREQKVAFWFATGGAGFCLSRGLALKMLPYTGGGRLRTMCEAIRLPDDCTLGYIISERLGKSLTIIPELHSHLEGLWRVHQGILQSQVTLSYMCSQKGEPNPFAEHKTACNTVKVPGFSADDDPTRFRSIHCLLHPNVPGCPNM